MKPNFKKNENGLLPVIAQDFKTNEVLMLAFMNETAFEKTVETKKATYFSRSRNTLWVKGETSGNTQIVKEIRIDCDFDTILIKVEQKGGAACHLGYRSCFFRKLEQGEFITTEKPIFDPQKVYGMEKK